MRFAYYDRDADIVWFPTGESNDVVSERVLDGLHEYDRTTRDLVAIEIWDASTRLPASLLDALPMPERTHPATARSAFAPLREDGDVTPVPAQSID